jgi:hypothetical protein
MKKMLFVAIVSVFLSISCKGTESTEHYKSANLTYSVSASSSTITNADIMYIDGSGKEITVANAALPWTVSLADFTYSKAWIWAQNNYVVAPSDISSTLTVAINTDDSWAAASNATATSSQGKNTIAQASFVFNFW